MTYRKQFHGRPYVSVLAASFGLSCILGAFFMDGLKEKIGMAAFSVFALVSSLRLGRAQGHYLEIDDVWIEHQGFTRWKVCRSEVTHVEKGRKGFLEEHDLYVKVHTPGNEYAIDDGFLINESRAEELARAMRRL